MMVTVLLCVFGYFIFWFVWHATYKPYPSTFCLYFGPPRCGKTTFLVRIIKKYRKKHPTFTNFSVNFPDVYKFNKSDIGCYDFGEHALLIFDEGSLNGFDNRDYKTNFQDRRKLEYFKLIGHFKTSICFGNQGWDELDKKIRTLTTQFWLVRRARLFSIALRVTPRTDVNDQDQIVDCYKLPNLLRILFTRKSLQICVRPFYYKYFDSFQHGKLPAAKKVSWHNHAAN